MITILALINAHPTYFLTVTRSVPAMPHELPASHSIYLYQLTLPTHRRSYRTKDSDITATSTSIAFYSQPTGFVM